MVKEQEKLEYLEHEDVETMQKRVAELRTEEVAKEKERIASLKLQEEKSEITGGTAQKIPPKSPEEKGAIKPLFRQSSLFKKILIRIIYLFFISAIVWLIYLFLVR